MPEILKNGGYVSLIINPYRGRKGTLNVYAENGKLVRYIKNNIVWSLVESGELHSV